MRLVTLRSSLKAKGVRNAFINGTEKLGLVNLEDHHSLKGGTSLASAAYSLDGRADVTLHDLDGWAALVFHPRATGGQRCTATSTSRGGSLV